MGSGQAKIDIQTDGTVVMIIDCEDCDFFPSIENEPKMMNLVMEHIINEGAPTIIKIKQVREYEYDANQTKILVQLAQTADLLREKLSRLNILQHKECKEFFTSRVGRLQDIFQAELLMDPVGAYVSLIRLRNDDKQILREGKIPVMPRNECLDTYVRFLDTVVEDLGKLTLIQRINPDVTRYKMGDRSVYQTVFRASAKADFMGSRLVAQYPMDGQILENYTVLDPLTDTPVADVTIFQIPDSERKLYHVLPIEANLTYDKLTLLNVARKAFEARGSEADHKHTAAYLENPRGHLYKVAIGLLHDLSREGKQNLTKAELETLASILTRNMRGFGIIEVLLTDKRVQDIVINSPTGKSSMFIKMRGYDECYTNVFPTSNEVKSWATRLRFLSSRPLDETHPILDTDKLEIPGNFRSRTAIITSPLIPVPGDYALAIRQHAPDPVTFARYSQSTQVYDEHAKKNKKWKSSAWGAMMLAPSKTMDGLPIAAGLLSFLVDGNRTFLVAGTRSSGKTTLLGSLLMNISRKVRIITIEDTLEIPVSKLRGMGYNIQSLKVRSALARGTTELSAEEGIRSTLRLGDSSLIVGEVRSTEAKSLYEAMRVGALANVVAGTIHANDPYGVFDRVVNDLEVPATSFKATDVIVMARPLPYRGKRCTSITEVRKVWTKDPLVENGFVDLIKFDHDTDSLEPTEDLLRGNSEILIEIGARYDAFSGKWDKIWENIILRAKIIQALIDKAAETDNPELIKAPFYVTALDAFRDISNDTYEEIKEKEGSGRFPPDDIYRRFIHWLEGAITRHNE